MNRAKNHPYLGSRPPLLRRVDHGLYVRAAGSGAVQPVGIGAGLVTVPGRGRCRGHAPPTVLVTMSRHWSFDELVRASEGVPRDALNLAGLAAAIAADKRKLSLGQAAALALLGHLIPALAGHQRLAAPLGTIRAAS